MLELLDFLLSSLKTNWVLNLRNLKKTNQELKEENTITSIMRVIKVWGGSCNRFPLGILEYLNFKSGLIEEQLSCEDSTSMPILFSKLLASKSI